MKTWSDGVHDRFSIYFFVDTNILAYLVDETYASLCDFIALAGECPFINLVSSQYVIFEFVGIRKKEHYLRKVASNSGKTHKGEINFNSLLKYQNNYEAPEAEFDTVINDISTDVQEELKKIATDYKINYSDNVLHGDQLEPTFEICLSTKIANQDSLVLVSSVLPQPKTTSLNLHLLTNDGDFVKSFKTSNIDNVFAKYKINKPFVNPINNLFDNGGTNINLTEHHTKIEVYNHLMASIVKMIVEKNQDLFIGKTFAPSNAGFPSDVICFKLKTDCVAPRDSYITVIGKDLDFVYTSKNKIEALWLGNAPLAVGYRSPSNQKVNVAYKVLDFDDTGNGIVVPKEIIDAIRVEGNLVFIHPDS